MKALSVLLRVSQIIQVVIAARGSLAISALFPRNVGDYKKYKTTP
jgi:hypothetical protein